MPRGSALQDGVINKGKRPLRALSASDKIDAIQRVNDGESKASVARDIGVPESTLRGWCKNEDKLRYMSSRHSTPDTDKSCDGITDIPDKRPKYDPIDTLTYLQNGAAPVQYATDLGTDLSLKAAADQTGLDLSKIKKDSLDLDTKMAADSSHVDFSAYTKATLDLSKSKSDLQKLNVELMQNLLKDSTKLKCETGANMSMSAISPLSNLSHLTGMSSLNQSHLGLSFNEIATNLSLIAQLNPSLSALTNTINSNAKALRSIRSPKPAHNSSSANSGMEKQKVQVKTDLYGEKSKSRSSHNSYKDPSQLAMDDSLWYWFKKQQAMLNLAATTTSTHNPLNVANLSTSRSDPANLSKNSTALPPMPQLDALNKNSWFWQYYKQFTGSMVDPTKLDQIQKINDHQNSFESSMPLEKQKLVDEINEESKTDDIIEKQVESPMNECGTPPPKDSGKSRGRAVLDNLLFNNNNNVTLAKPPVETEDLEKDSNTENEFDCEVSEALEHGEKFLKWLEACQEPSVTRMQVHQLKGMLNNLKASAERRMQTVNNKDRVSRRK